MRKLSESVWGDIRKKSLGQEERIEDDVNNLNMEGFFDYILKHYRVIVDPAANLNNIKLYTWGTTIEIPYEEYKNEPYYYWLSYDTAKHELLVLDSFEYKKEFEQEGIIFCKYGNTHILRICDTVSADPIDNKFALKVIEMLVDIIKRPGLIRK